MRRLKGEDLLMAFLCGIGGVLGYLACSALLT